MALGSAGLFVSAWVQGDGSPRWVGVAFALTGAALILLGVVFLRTGTLIGGVPGLLSELAFLLAGVPLVGIALLLVLLGFSAPDSGIVIGVPMVLVGLAILLVAVIFRRRGGDEPVASAVLLVGVALVLLGMASLLGWASQRGAHDSVFIFAVLFIAGAVTAGCIAALLLGAAILRDGAGIGLSRLRT